MVDTENAPNVLGIRTTITHDATRVRRTLCMHWDACLPKNATGITIEIWAKYVCIARLTIPASYEIPYDMDELRRVVAILAKGGHARTSHGNIGIVCRALGYVVEDRQNYPSESWTQVVSSPYLPEVDIIEMLDPVPFPGQVGIDEDVPLIA